MTNFDSYFYSLVKPKTPRKKRACLRCGKVFLSDNYGNRVCAQCREIKVGAVESQMHVPYEVIRHRI